MESASRRVAALGAHLGNCRVGAGDAGLEAQPTSTPAVQRELQLLLEHDSHGERAKMKDLLNTELFVP